MDVTKLETPTKAGFAMLLGPDFSIVLQSPKVILGRAHSSSQHRSHRVERTSSSASSKHLQHGSLKSSQCLHRSIRPSRAPVSTSTDISTTSPLYWRREWAKQQKPTDSVNAATQSLLGADRRPNYDDAGLIDLDTSIGGNNISIDERGKDLHPVKAEPSTMDINEAHTAQPTSSTMLLPGVHQAKVSVKLESTQENLVASNSGPLHSSSLGASSNILDDSHHGQSQPHPDCDIDLGPDPLISHYHATISYDPDLVIWDITCHSKNGLQVNGRTLYPTDGPALLSAKSRLQIGSVLFLFLLPVKPLGQHETADASSSRPTITSNKACEGLIVDQQNYKPSKPASATEATTTTTKKRKAADRSMLPLALIELVEEPDTKRRFFGEHVSKRLNSFRSLYSGINGDKTEQPWQEDVESDELTMPYLSASFNPRLETYNESDRRARYSSAASASSPPFKKKPDAPSESARGTPKPGSAKGSRGTKSAPVAYDASGTALERPKLNYGQLIRLALETAAEKRMPFSEITDWIVATYPYFATGAAGNWHNSVRHQLSNTPHFVRHERTKEMGKGKGGLWALTRWYDGDRLLSRPRDRD